MVLIFFFSGDRMMVTLVSGNKHKFDEMVKILKPFGIDLLWKTASLEEREGLSLEETAREKASQAFDLVNGPVVSEDTGVFFDAFENFPGSMAKRVWTDIGFDGLLERVRGKNRRARFVTIVCFTENGSDFTCFKGEVVGRLTERVHDAEKDVLPYEKIFVPEGRNCTMSSISRAEKNTFSHRFRATKKFGEWLGGRKN